MEKKYLNPDNQKELIEFIRGLRSQGMKHKQVEKEIFDAGWLTGKGLKISQDSYRKMLEKSSVTLPVIYKVDKKLLPEPGEKSETDVEEELFTDYKLLHEQGEAYKATKDRIQANQIKISEEKKNKLLTRVYWSFPRFPESWLKNHFNFKSIEDMEKVVGTCDEVSFFCTQCDETIEVSTRLELADLQQKTTDGLSKVCKDCRRIQELREMAHADYINTPEWKVIRQAHLIKEGNNKCQTCSAVNNLVVHHNNYANKGQEKPGDLVTLCNDCHLIFHQAKKLNGVYDTGAVWTSKKKLSA